MMDWNKLFSVKRFGEAARDYSEDRNPYDTDFDRVVFSSAFRRLQDKTQVIPLPEFDFVHSRLTHSLETSCVGRSLGRAVGLRVVKEYGLTEISFHHFGSVVAAACLAHDIGNPPFGHSGEDAISTFFRSNEEKLNIGMKEEEWNDLINFEGNANGFRILTNKRNAQLTYTTLAAFTKYPCQSVKSENITAQKRTSQKKYGFFQSEKNYFESICNALELRKLEDGAWCRHPLAFLVEAADDICYRIIDFEDGVRIGLIPFRQAEEILSCIVGGVWGTKYDTLKDESEKIAYLRALVINVLIQEVVEEFWSNEKKILAGDYDKNLVKQISSFADLEKIEIVSREKIYESPSVLQIETSGFTVVAGLLELFINAVDDANQFGNKLRDNIPLSAIVIKLLPKQFLCDNREPDESRYKRVLQVADFVAGMTDTYAVTLFKRLNGIQLAHS
jgi:dGTPase